VVLLLDCDEITAGFVEGYLKCVAEHTGRQFRAEDITNWNLARCIKLPTAVQGAVNQDIRSPGFCTDLPVLPGSQEGVRALREVVDILWVTTPLDGSPTWCGERLEWLKQHFQVDPKDVIFTHQKQRVRGNALCDDNPENLKGFPGVQLLWDKPYNREAKDHIRICNWAELKETVKFLDGDFEIETAGV
jgi:5'-nucleotidase